MTAKCINNETFKFLNILNSENFRSATASRSRYNPNIWHIKKKIIKDNLITVEPLTNKNFIIKIVKFQILLEQTKINTYD